MGESSFEQNLEIAGALKFFFWGMLFFALPTIIPTFGVLEESGYEIMVRVSWPCSVVAVVMFGLAALKVSKAQKPAP